MPLVDAHQHFWKLDQPEPFDYAWLGAPGLEPIHRDRLPEHLEPHLEAAGVKHTVFVQAQHHTEETRWALQLADRHPWIAGVVGWVDLASDHCEQQLEQLAEHPRFVGVRHVTHDEPDDDFIVRSEILRGLKTLEKHRVPFDLLFFVRHLPHAAAVADHAPDLPLIIDHLAKPEIARGRVGHWIGPLRDAARRPNVFCKLSGLITEADHRHWTPADLRPYVEAALEAFGPERCMFGSDWPVCELAGSYQQAVDALDAALPGLSDSERARIDGGTAAEVHGLNI